jgi:glycosyltransferase involved in cell wall biosynthesis
MNQPVLCQLDHLVVSSEALFGFGWAVPRQSRITRAWLDLRFATESTRRVAVSIERPREDVAAAFPDNPAAAQAGFMLLAGWPGERPQTASLAFDLADGDHHTVPLTLPVADTPRPPAGIGWRYLAGRAWAHLRLGRLRTALHKYRELRRRSGTGLAAVPAGDLATALRGRAVTLILDHSMGGGANAYRDRVIAELSAAGAAVVLLTLTVSALAFSVELHERGRPPRAARCDTLSAVRALFAGVQLQAITYNCGVSFPQGLEVARFLHDLTTRSRAPLEIVIHDYYTVCPSAFLLDDQGRFCGVPDLARCRDCLPAQTDGFVSLAACDSIDAWRGAWGSLLREATTIRCFSESSRRLIARAYPDLAVRLTVRPHAVPPLAAVPRRPGGRAAPLVIGVIGSISLHKGAAVVADLARAIVAAEAAVRIVVIGQVDAACPADVVLQTGEYDRDQLPELVARHQLDLVLLPSICPETFSFVAHETLAMGLPLVSLDLGAPADLARSHPLGHVAASADGPELLADLLAFADLLAGRFDEPRS